MTNPSTAVRDRIVEALRLDLVGPDNAHPFAQELLPESPGHWYLTGFLVPAGAPLEQRVDATSDDEIDSGAAAAGSPDDDTPPERPAAQKGLLSSSLGLSVLVAPEVDALSAEVEWGDYAYEGGDEPADGSETATPSGGTPAPAEADDDAIGGAAPAEAPAAKRKPAWRRVPHAAKVRVPLKNAVGIPIPDSNGLQLAVTVRVVPPAATASGRLPDGTRSVSVFVVNRRAADTAHRYRACAFQVRLQLIAPRAYVPRPDLRGLSANDAKENRWDERVADLQFHDVVEYAVGHGVSATWTLAADGTCSQVESAWIPQAEVERVAPSTIRDVELGMESLGQLIDGIEAATKLMPLVTHYRDWLVTQRHHAETLKGEQSQTAGEMLAEAEQVAARIEAGIHQLADAQVLEAFRIANRAMAAAARRKNSILNKRAPEAQDAPTWRPFQLAFILTALRSIAEPIHGEREQVDLLFFPTGGGKTEAYLGLAAFTLVLRRLRNPSRKSGGLSVLMRYTLRLLTLDQLGRAAALICALELEREQNKAALGEWPFEIGLWVGQAATPNRMGSQGDDGAGREYTAYTKVHRFRADSDKHPSPIPIEECPWCGTKFDRNSFKLVPNEQHPLDLRVTCGSYTCDFSGDRPLPIVAVDEPIYRRLPAFMIATVDKFAALPWTGETGALFGHVERYDKDGYYGPMAPKKGAPLGGPLPPPDLIIQDELHLISGPLGTIAGVYEAAIDKLSSRQIDGKNVRPKIIASTATVRRAEAQIQALFDRQQVTVFPPPGPDRRDSFFAHTVTSDETPARLYVGVAAAGRSLKVILLRSSLALLSAAQTSYEEAGGKKNQANPADPYMTLLGYFNSLRELGGSRRIMEDEVRTRLLHYNLRRRYEPDDALFSARKIDYDVLELTSRVSTSDVAHAKQRLALNFAGEDRVDAALATNMISVGLDITRLGLMVVLGQPKTSAEYIQATSRVGRDDQRPGLVVTLLNVHKPRDRSHYERFAMYHHSFYRAVEATSVTPFSPRALDRALPAVLVALARLTRTDMTPPRGASAIRDTRSALDVLSNYLAERARTHAWPPSPEAGQALHDHVLHRCTALLDDWLNIFSEFHNLNVALQYQKEEQGPRPLLHTFLDPELRTLPPVQTHFRANRSMREVEPSVDLFVKALNEWGNRT
jgi:Helicase conserved C-terminal domain